MFKIVVAIIILWEGYKLLFPQDTVLTKANLLLLEENPVIDLTNREPGVIAAFPGQKIMKDGVLVKTIPFSREMRFQLIVDLVYMGVVFILLIAGPIPCKLAAVSVLLMSKLSKRLPATIWATRLDSTLTIIMMVITLLAI